MKLCWLPRYWIELFRGRKDPIVKIFITRLFNGEDKRVVSAMKMAAKHEKSKSIRKLHRGYMYDTYLVDFRRGLEVN